MYQRPVSEAHRASPSLVVGRVDIPRPSAVSAAAPTPIPRSTEQPDELIAQARLAGSPEHPATRSGWAVIRTALLTAKTHDHLASMHERAAVSAPPTLGRHRRRIAQHHRDVAQAWRSTVDRALAELVTITRQSGPSRRAAATNPDSHELPPALAESLSRREMEVLRHLPSELTAAEIGAELYVSVNTVKAHMRSIYRKLGVSRRREAVVQARSHGLL